MIKDGKAHCDECGKHIPSAQGKALGGRLVCAACGDIIEDAIVPPYSDWERLRNAAFYRKAALWLIVLNWVLMPIGVIVFLVIVLMSSKPWFAIFAPLVIIPYLQLLVLLFAARHVLQRP
jgi:hypothetical protein